MKKMGTQILASNFKTFSLDLGAAKGANDQGFKSMHRMVDKNDMNKRIIVPIRAAIK